MTFGRRLVVLGAAIVASGAGALAHPISQGALDLDVGSDAIVATARVPVEEVFVAGALGSATASTAPSSLFEAWREHGTYLLRHLRVAAGGRILAGTLVDIRPPPSPAVKTITYELRYETADPATSIDVEQDVLREIEYAPGNPWEATYVVRFLAHGRPVEEGLLLCSARPLRLTLGSFAGTTISDRGRMFGDYVRHGVAHILGGYDHLLFIVALALAAVSFWDLVKVIGAFTLAHSLTLTLSVLHIVRLPSSVVEPMIAASIVVVALSNVLWPTRSRGWARLITAFFFGLFHGLGFAGGLLDAMQGLPASTVGIAIVAFSLGVELGHQSVVLPLFGALSFARRKRRVDVDRDRLSLVIFRGGSLAISAAGMAYFIAAVAR